LTLALPKELKVITIDLIDEILTISAVSTLMYPCCPLCMSHASRVHSHYTRRIMDLPCGGQRVCLLVLVRKYFCDVTTCTRRIFTERITPFIAPWARVTTRLHQIVQAIGLATSGMLGARLADRLGIHTSWMTVLRRIMALPTEAVGQVTQLGVDDFAFRRGHHYGTILVNMQTHQVIDMLPDRKTETVAQWMQLHPEIELVSRDRGTDYAAAARSGAPQAIQVADRFHLAKNLTDLVEVILARCRAEIRQTMQSEEISLDQEDDFIRAEWRPKTEPDEQQVGLARQAERHDRYEQMIELSKLGLPTKEIARRMGMTRRTVERWLLSGLPYTQPRKMRQSCFNPYEHAARELWQNGALSSLQIWQKLQLQGFKGSYRTVHRFIETLPEYSKKVQGSMKFCTAVPENSVQNFRARKAVWLFVRDPDGLDVKEQKELQAICRASSTAMTTYTLAQEFLLLMRQRKGERLDEWLEKAHASGVVEFDRLVHSIERDKAAIVTGFTVQTNNGLVEGKVNKLKLVKRMMFGRAGFELLRQRILHAL